LRPTVLQALGHDPLPKYPIPPEGPQGDPQLVKQYPCTLTDGRSSLFYNHAEWRQVESVCIHRPEPIVCLHLQSARSEGTAEGDWIWIETKRGRIRQKVQLFDRLDRSIVDAEHGWWYPEMPGPEPSLYKIFESTINM